jgi:methylated-DNA-[protein]-cysteine S-methyltransferase
VSPAVEAVTYEVPRWGVGELVLHEDRPILHALPIPARPAARRHLAPGEADERAGVADLLVSQLARYFAGEQIAWTADAIALDETLDEMGASAFQRATAHAMVATPYGARISYGDLAHEAGFPRAARAAGTFCAENPLPLFLPCHRIVRGDGTIGGYGSLGLRYKRRLLDLERRRIAA